MFLGLRFDPTPSDEPDGHHRTGDDEPYALRGAKVVDIDIDDTLVVKVIDQNSASVVEEVHEDARPQ